MKAIIINNEIKFDEDALSLADMGYEIGEEIEVFDCIACECCFTTRCKKEVVIDGIVAIYEGEEITVSYEEIEVLA